MNNEQLEIERRFGKNQPFKVPEGYFDRLAADVMANIPEHVCVLQCSAYSYSFMHRQTSIMPCLMSQVRLKHMATVTERLTWQPTIL